MPPQGLLSAFVGLWVFNSPGLSQARSMRSASSHLIPESITAMRTASSPWVHRQAKSIDIPLAFSSGLKVLLPDWVGMKE